MRTNECRPSAAISVSFVNSMPRNERHFCKVQVIDLEEAKLGSVRVCIIVIYCDLRGWIKGTARALYLVHSERAHYGQ